MVKTKECLLSALQLSGVLFMDTPCHTHLLLLLLICVSHMQGSLSGGFIDYSHSNTKPLQGAPSLIFP